MIMAAGSAVLAVLNLAAMVLIAERRRAGWLVALGSQVPWTIYDVATRQYGFLLLSAVYVPVYLRGWRTRAARRPPACQQHDFQPAEPFVFAAAHSRPQYRCTACGARWLPEVGGRAPH
jgi:hypothetical protein